MKTAKIDSKEKHPNTANAAAKGTTTPGAIQAVGPDCAPKGSEKPRSLQTKAQAILEASQPKGCK
jgi:hypothetical protein